MMLSEGEQPTTLTGRLCTPFPKVSCETNRKTTNTFKRVDAWLQENAVEEARSKNDDFVSVQFEHAGPKLTPADKDCMNFYLFGE